MFWLSLECQLNQERRLVKFSQRKSDLRVLFKSTFNQNIMQQKKKEEFELWLILFVSLIISYQLLFPIDAIDKIHLCFQQRSLSMVSTQHPMILFIYKLEQGSKANMLTFMFQRGFQVPRILISLIIITFSSLKQYMTQQFLSQTYAQKHKPEQLNPSRHFNQNINTISQRVLRQGKQRTANKAGEERTNRQQFQSSLWRLSQNISYMHFILENVELFRGSRNDRKTSKINVLMSAAVGTRSPSQCRSHHQKMIKYHQDIPNIVKHIRNLTSKQQNLNESPLVSLPVTLSLPPSGSALTQAIERVQSSPNTIFDWDSWVLLNEKVWEQRMNQEWLSGVEDIYGNI